MRSPRRASHSINLRLYLRIRVAHAHGAQGNGRCARARRCQSYAASADMITADQILDYNPEIVPALGNVRFEIMRAFVEEDDLDKLEFEMRGELNDTIRAWLAELSNK